MIKQTQIVGQPISGTYKEYVYNATESTEQWTWVKLVDEEYNETIGQFPGAPNQVALSLMHPVFYVLTDAFLFEIQREDLTNYEFYDFWDLGSTFKNVTFTPEGMPIFSDDYKIFTFQKSFETRHELPLPLDLDMIEFGDWNGHLLTIHAQEFFGGRPVRLVLNAQTRSIQRT